MNKRGLIRTACERLRQNNIRKPILIPKQVFYISDDEGNTKTFTIRKTDKTAIYTVEDVEAILDAVLDVVQDNLRRGEETAIFGFGSLGLHYWKPRATKLTHNGENMYMEGRFIPKFSSGNNLRMCAKVYELSLGDRLPEETDIAQDNADA